MQLMSMGQQARLGGAVVSARRQSRTSAHDEPACGGRSVAHLFAGCRDRPRGGTTSSRSCGRPLAEYRRSGESQRGPHPLVVSGIFPGDAAARRRHSRPASTRGRRRQRGSPKSAGRGQSPPLALPPPEKQRGPRPRSNTRSSEPLSPWASSAKSTGSHPSPPRAVRTSRAP